MKSKIKLWNESVTFNQDDQKLFDLVQIYGLKKWKFISSELKNKFDLIRTSKQCRDRWFNNLKIKSESGLPPEDVSLLFKLIEIHGSKWSKLSEIITYKTENQLKNFVYATIRRNIRRFNKVRSENDQIKFTSLKLLSIPEVRNVLIAPKSAPNSIYINASFDEGTKMMIFDIGKNEKKLDDNTEGESGDIVFEDDTHEEFFWSDRIQSSQSILDIDLFLESI